MPRILVRVVGDQDTVQGINVLASWEFVRFGSEMAKQEEVTMVALSCCGGVLVLATSMAICACLVDYLIDQLLALDIVKAVRMLVNDAGMLTLAFRASQI